MSCVSNTASCYKLTHAEGAVIFRLSERTKAKERTMRLRKNYREMLEAMPMNVCDAPSTALGQKKEHKALVALLAHGYITLRNYRYTLTAKGRRAA